VTVIELAVTDPGFQVKEPTAAGLTTDKVVVPPGQTIVGEGVTVILGPGSTLTLIVAAFVQEPEAPTAVNVVDVNTVNVGLRLTMPPGYQVTVLAPAAIMETVPPVHTSVGEMGKIITVGGMLMPMLTVAVLVQPETAVPTTV